MTGSLLLAAFMALVIVGAGLPTGLFTRPVRAAATSDSAVPAAPEEGTR